MAPDVCTLRRQHDLIARPPAASGGRLVTRAATRRVICGPAGGGVVAAGATGVIADDLTALPA